MKADKTSGKPEYLPIGYKLMLSYTIFVIILVSVNGFVSHGMYDASMRKQANANIGAALQQIRDNVSYKTDDMMRISDTLYDDYQLIQQTRRRLDDSSLESYERMENVIFPKLESAVKSIGLQLTLHVYFANDTIKEKYYTKPAEGSLASRESRYNVYHMSRIRDRDWYRSLPEEAYGETVVWRQVEDDAELGRISMIRRMVDMSNPFDIVEAGVMRFSVSLSELLASVDSRKLGEGSLLMVSDGAGRPVYRSGGLSALEAGFPSDKAVTIRERMERPEWHFEAIVPMTVIAQEAKRVQAYILAVCVLCFALFTIAGFFISRYFSKRVTKFVAVLNAFRNGDLHKRIAYRGKDEFSQIADALNRMGEDIGQLIDKVYLTQLQKKEAELEMLQTQINPHFLYNTLSSINQLAKFGENEKLSRMVVDLAKFYRLTLNSGKALIPVCAEIEQCAAYLNIQKVKYGRRMDVTFDVDPSVWPYETLKLLLQPFAENALKHAWSGDRIHIRIVVKLEGDTIRYRIIDDGMGIRPDRLRELLSDSGDSETGFGIRNIHQRVGLHYGPGYGVTIFSLPGAGTSVDIRIPARKRKPFAGSDAPAV